jgi:CNT family concentrative nucleoside transporter
MRKVFIWIALMVVLAGTSHASRPKEQKMSNHLVREWIFFSIKDTNGTELYTVGAGDHLSISRIDNRFSYLISEAGIHLSGTWFLNDSTMVFLYDHNDTITTVDSVLFSVQRNKPELAFYADGKLLSRMLDDRLQADSLIRSYTVLTCTNDSLVFAGPDGVYTCVVDPSFGIVKSKESGGFNPVAVLRGLLGLAVLIGIAYLLSTNRRSISWRVIILGLLIQLVIAFLVLKVPGVHLVFEFMGKVFIKILDFSKIGGSFLFKSLVTNKVEIALVNFAFQILPTIIFFSALTSILFYYGIIQKVVYVFAWLLTKLLKISGAESLSTVSNIFLGQTEAPLLIKEYLERMNRSEIMLVMTGGMATMAGGVLAIYIGVLGGTDPVQQVLFAKHLISASVMAAPGAIVAAKLLVPQTEQIHEVVQVSRERIGSNILEAISNGTSQGLRLAANVAAMLIAFIALIAMINFILAKVGDWTTLNTFIDHVTNGRYDHFSLQFMLGYALSPLAWLMGICKEDMALIGQLLGEKTILNEMIAYISMKDYVAAGAFSQEKSMIMATYILCGFANFSSIGIQLGGIGALAPGKRILLSQLGFRALVGGILASLFSATIIGIILG